MVTNVTEQPATPRTALHPLLAEVLDAHGGLARWRRFSFLSATIVTGGEFWGMKGVVQDSEPREIRVDLKREWASLRPYGDPDWSSIFMPARVAIVESHGKVIAERPNPVDAFAGHDLHTPWDPLHRAYFNGEALWTYLTVPFVLAGPDFLVEDIPEIIESGEVWNGLRVTFPAGIATHSTMQDFYFGPDRLLRRHDYHVDVAGGFPAVHLVSNFVEVEGLRFPTRRRAYQRDEALRPRLDPLMVSIDLSNFNLR